MKFHSGMNNGPDYKVAFIEILSYQNRLELKNLDKLIVWKNGNKFFLRFVLQEIQKDKKKLG